MTPTSLSFLFSSSSLCYSHWSNPYQKWRIRQHTVILEVCFNFEARSSALFPPQVFWMAHEQHCNGVWGTPRTGWILCSFSLSMSWKSVSPQPVSGGSESILHSKKHREGRSRSWTLDDIDAGVVLHSSQNPGVPYSLDCYHILPWGVHNLCHPFQLRLRVPCSEM